MQKHLDSDLEQMLKETVPPVQLDRLQSMRLHNEMQMLSFQETSAKVLTDIQHMSTWADACKDFHNRQGLLDLRYMNERFNQGKQKVADFMNRKHSYVLASEKELTPQAEILRFVGGALVDDSFDTIDAILNGNPNAALLCLATAQHSNMKQEVCVLKGRLLEDRLMSSFLMVETSLVFSDSSHASDRRKKSQRCWICVSKLHDKSPWLKSRCTWGTIGPIERARVVDLQQLPDDKPLTPAHRVMQRGVPAVQQIINQLVDGLNLRSTDVILLVDCMCNRFNEWGLASQQEMLTRPAAAKFDLAFLGFVWLEEDGEFTDRLPNQIAATIMILAAGLAMSMPKVKIYITKDYKMFVANLDGEDLALSSCELFGYGLGSWSVQLAGPVSDCVARMSTKQSFPWHLGGDADAIVAVDGNQKKVLTLAEMICETAQKHGLMEFACHDYNLVQQTKAFVCGSQADGSAENWRYVVSSKTKLSVYTPKPLPADVDKLNVRGSMLGAVFADAYDKIPRNKLVQTLFEVG
eukprot:Skav234435  [mRNA]  locus=scaffold3409:116777:120527:- [translate_table: standard]